ncbi:MAG: Helicase associated domain protein, partial [Legionellales bacterium]|nr:Helicase associated domain protein [Legionellales bacterium]
MADLKTWDERFTELKNYKKKYKHCNVSRRDGS